MTEHHLAFKFTANPCLKYNSRQRTTLNSAYIEVTFNKKISYNEAKPLHQMFPIDHNVKYAAYNEIPLWNCHL